MDRIQKIRKHKNYWVLPRVKRFWNVVDKLSHISKSGKITAEDKIYLSKVERELKRLKPGTRSMIVEGKTEQVDTLYLGNEDK